MNGEKRYQTIKDLVDHDGNKDRAAITLGCSRRSIDRYVAGYREKGKEFFVHGNSGRKPATALGEGLKGEITELYMSKYYDANFSHFTELLEREEGITVSESSVRNIMAEAEILSPKATKHTRKAYKAKLKAKLGETKTKKEKEQAESKIIAAEDAHPRRPRYSNFGELIQMDASELIWANGEKWTLHLAIDDATGIIVGAWFDEQETLQGYYHVTEQILSNYGIPFRFYTDRRTVFEYRKSGSQDIANDTFTQFGYACKTLGIEIRTTSIAQAKGRIERLNETVQSRLPIELRIRDVITIEQANEYLSTFIANLNAKFALSTDSITSVFEIPPSEDEIDRTLAVISERSVDSGHSIRYDKKYFRIMNRAGDPVYFSEKTKGLVICTFSKKLFFSCQNELYSLEEIPVHERVSKNFDTPIDEPKTAATVYIPPINHPWRRDNFIAFCKKSAFNMASSA
jgi:transposase